MSKIKNGGLDQYGAGPFEQQQFGTAGIEGVNADTINNKLLCGVAHCNENTMNQLRQTTKRVSERAGVNVQLNTQLVISETVISRHRLD